jgi:hypothetical protein
VVLNPDTLEHMTGGPPPEAGDRDRVGAGPAVPGTRTPSSVRRVLALDERYDVHVNAFLPAANNHLFNEPAFFRLHSVSPKDVYAQLVRRADALVFATIGFHEVDHGGFASLRRGTFGGLSQNQPVDLGLLEAFVGFVLDLLHGAGAAAVEIRCAPLSHDAARLSTFANVLLRRGAVVCGHELNFDLTVDDRPFVDRIDYGNVKRIRKCVREGFVARTLLPAEYDAAHDLIRRNRERRGYPITMTARQVEDMATTFPDRVHCFGVFNDETSTDWAAAAICMAITSEILYIAYWGDGPDLGSFSPVALLASAIYEFAKQNGYRLLDAGIATSEGLPNPGLVTFKRNLGFSESLKLAFRVSA